MSENRHQINSRNATSWLTHSTSELPCTPPLHGHNTRTARHGTARTPPCVLACLPPARPAPPPPPPLHSVRINRSIDLHLQQQLDPRSVHRRLQELAPVGQQGAAGLGGFQVAVVLDLLEHILKRRRPRPSFLRNRRHAHAATQQTNTNNTTDANPWLYVVAHWLASRRVGSSSSLSSSLLL